MARWRAVDEVIGVWLRCVVFPMAESFQGWNGLLLPFVCHVRGAKARYAPPRDRWAVPRPSDFDMVCKTLNLHGFFGHKAADTRVASLVPGPAIARLLSH